MPRSTLEEALHIAHALRDHPSPTHAELLPIEPERASVLPCDACNKRTGNMAAWLLTGTSSFYCEDCVESAREYGLVTRDDAGRRARFLGERVLDEILPGKALPDASATRAGQRSPLANYARAYRIVVQLAQPLADHERARLAKLGIQVPVRESDKRGRDAIWKEMQHNVHGALILMQGVVTTAMEEAVPFLLPEGIADLLSLTDAPARDEAVHLPFPGVWLDGQFQFEERTYYGILAVETAEGQPPIPLSEKRLKNWDGPRSITIATVYEDVHGKTGALALIDALGKKPQRLQLDLHTKVARSEFRDLAGILQSWLYLLESPQVRTETRVPSRREQDMHQRAVGRKAPATIVHVRIMDRALLESIERFRAGRSKYSHSFWVRGHWRTLRSVTRFKENAGKRMWIAPFVKGEGILIEKAYQVDEPHEPEADP